MVEADKEQNSNENKNNQSKTKKTCIFYKTCIYYNWFKSYKKLNEDISETRFYYMADKKEDNNEHAEANCSWNIFKVMV